MKAFYITGEGRAQYLQQHTKPECVKLTADSVAVLKACHGLTIPDNVPPGALTALVDAARAVVAAEDSDPPYAADLAEPWTAFRAALAPFNVSPV